MILAVLVFAGFAAWWSLVGKTIVAPDWLRDRIAAQVAKATPDIPLHFDDVVFRLNGRDAARVTLTNLEIGEPSSGASVILSEVTAGVAPVPLIRRQIVLNHASISGAFLTLERDINGQFAFASGANSNTSFDLPTLLEQIDVWLDDPRFERLRKVEADAITLRYEDRRANRGWTADGGRISVARRDGTLRLDSDMALLTGGANVATVSLNAESAIGENDLSFGVTVNSLPSQDIATQSPALAWLETIRAPISGALRGYLLPDGYLGGLDATLNISEGVLQPSDQATPIAFKTARTYFSYAPQTQSLNFSEIFVDSDKGSGRAEGQVAIALNAENELDAFVGQFAVQDLNAQADGVFEQPLIVDRADIDAQLRLEPFKLDLGRIRIADPDLPLIASGTLSVGENGWEGKIDGRFKKAVAPEVLNYWPVTAGPKSRRWAFDNVKAGNVSNGLLALRFQQGSKPDFFLDFAFKDATVKFARTLPPVSNGSGQFTLYDHRLAINLDAGQVVPPKGGALNVAGSQFVIPDGRIKPATGQLSLVANGPAPALFSFLDQKPIGLMGKLKKPYDFVKGDIAAKGRIELPLRKGLKLPDIAINLKGTARNTTSTDLIKGRALKADRLDVAVTNSDIKIAGKATLDGIPFDGEWAQTYGPNASGGRLVGTVALSDAHARTFGVALPQGMVSGAGTGRLTVDLPRNQPPEFQLVSDLAGIGLSIPALGYGLGRKTKGRLSVSGRLGQPVKIDDISIDAGGLTTSAKVDLKADGTPASIALNRVRLGGWLDAKVTLTPRGNRPPAVKVHSGTVDMRRASFGQGGGGASGATTPIDLALNRLDLANGISLSDVVGKLSIGGGVSGAFSARMGKAKLTGELEKKTGGTAVQVKSDNLGNVLRATGLLKTVVGGDMTLSLAPVSGRKGTYNGSLAVTNTRLRDAPAIGSLLDAISVVGIIDQLEGPGIYFQNVDAQFQLTPEQLVLNQSSATGPSMGISLDGFYNLASKQLDMQGVVSPIYILNGIGSLFTRRGEGLIGFNFNLTGAASNPKVAVNPLSVFTPGMFREIFRRAPPKPSQ